MEFIKKNIVLVIGMSIPILMIIFVAGSIYLPSFFIKPQYDFIYADGNNPYFSKYEYFIQNGKLEREQKSEYQERLGERDQKLYVYEVEKNKSKEISFEEAQKLTLDPSSTSPDGFEITYGKKSEGFFPIFFWSHTDYETLYIKGHNVISKKLNIQPIGNYLKFTFLGWIK